MHTAHHDTREATVLDDTGETVEWRSALVRGFKALEFLERSRDTAAEPVRGCADSGVEDPLPAVSR
jgi:hypothetical protein